MRPELRASIPWMKKSKGLQQAAEREVESGGRVKPKALFPRGPIAN